MWQIFLNFGRILGYRKAHDFSRFNINICDDDFIYIYGYIIKASPKRNADWKWAGEEEAFTTLFMLYALRLTRGVLFAGFSCPLFAAFFCGFFPI